MTDILDPTMLRARSEVRCVLLFPAEIGPTLADAVEIADESACCDITSACRFINTPDGGWYDTGVVGENEWQFVDRSVRYLSARSRLIKHPIRAGLVRLTEAHA